HVYPPVSRFAVVDPTLRPPQPLAQLPLGEAGLLPQGPQEFGKALVSRAVLGFGRHLTRLSGQASLTRVKCQTTMPTLFSCQRLQARASTPGMSMGRTAGGSPVGCAGWAVLTMLGGLVLLGLVASNLTL